MLVINTLPKGEAEKAVCVLEKTADGLEAIHTEKMDIRPCVGCNFCWLKTPGICSVKDDYEVILKALMKGGTIVLIGGTAFGAADHRLKNILDRSLPLVTMFTTLKNGEMRHTLRYKMKQMKLLLLYSGEGDREYLNVWLNRVAINFGGKSLGAFPINEAEVAAKCV